MNSKISTQWDSQLSNRRACVYLFNTFMNIMKFQMSNVQAEADIDH